MSRSGFSHSPIAGDTTRQKLDELEALIQQMLNLPVNRLDPDWPSAPEEEDRGQRTEDREQRTEDRGQRTEDGKAGVEGSGHGHRTEEEREQKIEATEADCEQQSEQIGENEDGQPGTSPSVLCPPSSVLCPSSPRWWLYPIVGLNLLFDGLTFLLGPLGRWLRSETGRLVMGWAGVALLLAALVWTVLGWMGWIE